MKSKLSIKLSGKAHQQNGSKERIEYLNLKTKKRTWNIPARTKTMKYKQYFKRNAGKTSKDIKNILNKILRETFPKLGKEGCNPYNERHSECPTDRTRKKIV